MCDFLTIDRRFDELKKSTIDAPFFDLQSEFAQYMIETTPLPKHPYIS